MRNTPLHRYLALLFLFLSLLLPVKYSAHALTDAQIQEQIDAKQREKEALEIENKKLQQEIQKVGAQAKTLQNAVKTLDSTGKKLQSDLKVTSNRIDTTQLTISQLKTEIDKTENSVSKNRLAINETLRALYQIDDISFVQSLLQFKNVNELWSAVESLHQFQTIIKQKTDDLKNLQVKLQAQKDENEGKQKNLVELKSELSSRKTIVDQNKRAKSNLLSTTKSQESAYQKQLQINIERGKQFEQELFQFESQLSANIDKSKLPSSGSAVLSWPLSSVRITQRFGKTVDAARLYVSGSHNGVDFAASVGTAVKAVAGGVVSGMGNTDTQSGCYSYGRWILIDHKNGLSSLYSHLSGYNVSMGKTVKVGETVAFSGGQPGMSGSGFSTGPHLHLGLFATEAVRIEKYTSSKFCKNVTIPIAGGLNAYLDPLAYLP